MNASGSKMKSVVPSRNGARSSCTTRPSGARDKIQEVDNNSALLRVGPAQTQTVLAYFWALEGRQQHQWASWNSIPILNEWRQRFPHRDPVEVHEQLFGVRLQCPGGGNFEWDESRNTMVSSVYGHPTWPKPGPRSPACLEQLGSATLGLTFEGDGLRARGTLRSQ